MCKRLTNAAKVETNFQVDKIVTYLLDQIDGCERDQGGGNEPIASHIALLSALAKSNLNAMEKAKGKMEQLKKLALAWLRRAKEDPDDEKVMQLGETHLQTLKLLDTVLDKEAREQFFTDLFEESLGHRRVTICGEGQGRSAYAIYISFIEDKVTLFKNLVDMATKESSKERLDQILDIIERFEYFSRVV